MDTKVLNIGYGGWLQHFEPGMEASGSGGFKRKYLKYQVDNVNHYVRSAYYMFHALAQIKDPAVKIKVHLWGKIAEGNQDLANRLGVEEMIEISGSLSKAENLEKLRSMDMLFLPMEIGKGGAKSFFIPGKVYEYLLLEKPILAIGGDSDAKDLVVNSGLGFHFEHEDANGIAEFLSNCVINGIPETTINKELIASKSFDVLADELAAVFKSF